MDGPRPWRRTGTRLLLETPRIQVHRDDVVFPDGSPGAYEWVQATDLVRVAALNNGKVHLIEQHHYLAGPMWQLPGGAIDPGEDPEAAAGRELSEETGLTGGTWTSHGALWPMPHLATARVHLYSVSDARPGPAHPEAGEADLHALAVPLDEAATSPKVACAVSVALLARLAKPSQ